MQRRVTWMAGALVAAWLLSSLNPPKSIPGGPFLSVSGELAPIGLCLWVLWLGVISVRRAPADTKSIVAILIVASTILLAYVLNGIILFWGAPYSRGNLFGF